MTIKSLRWISAAVLTVSLPVFAQQSATFDNLKGQKMPSFSLPTLDGKTVTNASLSGKVALLSFTATWCGPCRAAAPKMQAMQDELGEKGFQFVAIHTLERGDVRKVVGDYIKEHGYKYTVALDTGNRLFRQLQGRGVPTYVVMDKTGTVTFVSVGFNEARIKSAVQEAMK